MSIEQTTVEPSTQRWGLILTGGGNRGAAQAVALGALFETGFEPELIVGVSVGAINGAYLAFHPNLKGVAAIWRIWRGLDEEALYGRRLHRLRTLAALVLGRPAAFSNRGLRRLLERELPSRRFEDTRLPFVVTATHLETGTARAIGTGDIVQAVLASAAVPVHLPPVLVDGERLIDGAIADPVPLHLVAAHGLTGAAVIEPGHDCSCRRVFDDALSVAQQSVSVLARRCIDAELRAGTPGVQIIHLGLGCDSRREFTDFSQSEAMLRSGYEEASHRLNSLPAGLPWTNMSPAPLAPSPRLAVPNHIQLREPIS